MYQAPAGHLSAEAFDAVSDYLVTKPDLCGKVMTVMTPRSPLAAEAAAGGDCDDLLRADGVGDEGEGCQGRRKAATVTQAGDQGSPLRVGVGAAEGLAADEERAARVRRHARLRRPRFDEAPSSVADGTDASHCAPPLDIIRTADSHFSNNMHTAMHNTSIHALSKRRTKAERSCERTTQG